MAEVRWLPRACMYPAGDRGGQTVTFVSSGAWVRGVRLLTGGKPAIEYIDAWVDPVTMGVRRARTGRVRVARVASTGPDGAGVYALRQGDGFVVFVSTPVPMSFRDENGFEASSSCEHMRFDLAPRPGETTARVQVACHRGTMAPSDVACDLRAVTISASRPLTGFAELSIGLGAERE